MTILPTHLGDDPLFVAFEILFGSMFLFGILGLEFGYLQYILYHAILFFPVLMLGAGLIAKARGVRQARFYVYAWSVYLVGTMLYYLRDWGFMPEGFATAYSAQIGSLVDGVLLSLALADRINILRDEKSMAQQNALEQEQKALKTAQDARDTLEVKVAERTAELEESEDRFRRLSNTTFEAILVHDNGVVLDVNESAERMSGYGRAELMGGNVIELLVAPEDVDTLKMKIKEGAEGAYEINSIRKDGSIFPAEIRGTPIIYQGKAVRAAVIRDLTERKLAEKAFLESEKRYRDLVESSPDSIVIHSEGRIIWMNNACAIFLRANSPDELIGRNVLDFVHPEFHQQVLKNAELLISGQVKFLKGVDEKYLRVDGSDAEADVSSSITVYKGKPAFQVIFRDVTQRKIMERELRQQKERAESATKLKDKFVSLVSHDLKSPISSIAMGVETVIGAAPELSAPNRNFLSMIGLHCRKLLNMIDKLLDISRLQTGKIRPVKRYVNCFNHANRYIEAIKIIADQKGIAIKNEMLQNMNVIADPDLLGQCIANLLANAIKFCGRGGAITVYNPPENPCVIAIRDTGTGIDGAMLKNLFIAEIKTTNIGTAGEKGTGLGLPYCREIMEALGGTISVESEVGRGSVFYLTLPETKLVIMVVDDQEVTWRMVREFLNEFQAEIVEAEDGLKALAILKEFTPQLIITDINMPNMDGLALIVEIKKMPDKSGIPIIVMTSDGSPTDTDPDIRSKVFRLGADDFVNKPVGGNDLIPRVKKYLEIYTDSASTGQMYLKK